MILQQVNALNEGIENNGSIAMPKLVSLEPKDENTLKEKPDFVYFVSYDFYKIDNPHFHDPTLYSFNGKKYSCIIGKRLNFVTLADTTIKQRLLTPQLNHISLKLPPFPLLSERHLIKDSMLCDESTVKNCLKEYCECTHVVHVRIFNIVTSLKF